MIQRESAHLSSKHRLIANDGTPVKLDATYAARHYHDTALMGAWQWPGKAQRPAPTTDKHTDLLTVFEPSEPSVDKVTQLVAAAGAGRRVQPSRDDLAVAAKLGAAAFDALFRHVKTKRLLEMIPGEPLRRVLGGRGSRIALLATLMGEAESPEVVRTVLARARNARERQAWLMVDSCH